MSRYLLCFLIHLVLSTTAHTSVISMPDSIPRPSNYMVLGLLGEASIISLNYERIIGINEKMFVSAKIGVGLSERNTDLFGSGAYIVAGFPHHVTLNLGGPKAFFEVGMGGSYLSGSLDGSLESYFLYPVIGVRSLSAQINRASFRFFVHFPVAGFEDIYYIPLGLSFGFGF